MKNIHISNCLGVRKGKVEVVAPEDLSLKRQITNGRLNCKYLSKLCFHTTPRIGLFVRSSIIYPWKNALFMDYHFTCCIILHTMQSAMPKMMTVGIERLWRCIDADNIICVCANHHYHHPCKIIIILIRVWCDHHS